MLQTTGAYMLPLARTRSQTVILWANGSEGGKKPLSRNVASWQKHLLCARKKPPSAILSLYLIRSSIFRLFYVNGKNWDSFVHDLSPSLRQKLVLVKRYLHRGEWSWLFQSLITRHVRIYFYIKLNSLNEIWNFSFGFDGFHKYCFTSQASSINPSKKSRQLE